MAIDIQTERLIGLDEAAKLFPGRDGGSVHKFTVGLYARRGKKGVKLETVLAGPRRCTTIEAVQRFIEAITAVANGEQPVQAVATRTRRQKNKAVRDSVAELEASGA